MNGKINTIYSHLYLSYVNCTNLKSPIKHELIVHTNRVKILNITTN